MNKVIFISTQRRQNCKSKANQSFFLSENWGEKKVRRSVKGDCATVVGSSFLPEGG
jgi:hypothetical protein